ncbi:ubiquitin-conjugating enzyme E2-22 kDa-like [Daphnia pulex]|uniref:ubiquitin-conjugating enzyme E2-22 kDa-like n=1 Tax=Daphnia pulex TaxID=6669 RepID=UPI001EDF316E|nr:ubiquitin-conjugating enzyme E2-22 kDa-like [Daphnia pulex]
MADPNDQQVANPQGIRSGGSGNIIEHHIAVQRIKHELKEVLNSDEVAWCSNHVELVGESFAELKGEIAGPPDTPYEGARFQLEIKIPERYPFVSPNFRFVTKIWHPNVSSVTGAICLEHQWAAAMTLRTALLSLQLLLASPEPDVPQDAVVARQCKDKPQIFQLTAQHWANAYAGGPSVNPDYENKIRRLKDLGVTEMNARASLSSCDWDLERATEQIFS